MSHKRFKSVGELLRETLDDPSVAKQHITAASSRRLVKHLIAFRVKNDLSQQDLAERMG